MPININHQDNLIGYTGSALTFAGNIKVLGSVNSLGYSVGDIAVIDRQGRWIGPKVTMGSGFTGSQGNKPGLQYRFTITSSESDPGKGNFSFNNSIISSVTEIRLSSHDILTNDVQAFITSWNNSSALVDGIIQIESASNTVPTFAIFQLISVTAETGFMRLVVSYIQGSRPSNNSLCVIQFSRVGKDGEVGFTGSIGPQGPQGDIGFTGSIGPQGPQGDIGFTGSIGPQGPQGVIGFTGSIGPQGPQGVIGFTGSIGPQGPQGVIGFTGSIGPQGPQGDIGFTGSIGPQGVIGFTGSIGPQGPQGDIGFTGSIGPQGVIGFTGSIGPQGPQGSTGFTGSRGFTGSIGPQGPTGFTGSIGPQGPQGSTGFTGSIGPQGPQGPQGVIGFTGSIGPQGPQGVIGFTGSIGPQGPQGSTGFTGSRGFTGSIGPQGPTGFTGSIGPQGPQGVIGFTGSIGPQGPQGVIGFTGSRGFTGSIGPQGPQGVIGFTGSQGVIGFTGSTSTIVEFNNLTNKTSGTGNYSTTGYLEAGRDGGAVALIVNDGGGHANVTFNHRGQFPDQAGNSGRIAVNVDATTGAAMLFGVKSGVTAGVSVNITNILTLNESGAVINTGIIEAPTFNATSLTSGGFQGIADDTATNPSFTWTGNLTTGLFRGGSPLSVRVSVNGTNRLTISETEIRPEVPITVGDDVDRGPIVSFGTITGGSGYVNGSYTAVPLTGGSGSLATADIVVSGGSVTSVTLVREGGRYKSGDSLSATAANLGGTGSGFSVLVNEVRLVSINIFGGLASSAPPRIRLMNSATAPTTGTELGSILFGANDGTGGGRGDKARIIATAAGNAGGGNLQFWTSANAGEPGLAVEILGNNDFRLYNSTATFYHTLSNTPTANRTVTIPDATFTIAGINIAQNFTSAQTFRAANAVRVENASTQDAIVFAGRAGGTSSRAITITPTTLSANRTYTLLDVGAAANFVMSAGTQTNVGSYKVTASNDGTKSSGTYTPALSSGSNMKYITNGGAFTLAAPSDADDFTMLIQITNNATAGAITLSAFTRVTGSPFTTTDTHKFIVHITKLNSFTHAHVVALQ